MNPASTALQFAFIGLAAVSVYGFAHAARNDHTRASCKAVCELRPAYAGENRLAPDFELSDMDGKKVRLSEYRGRTLVLNFWTKTCKPCLEEMPAIAELAKIAKGREDIAVLTVSTDEGPEDGARHAPGRAQRRGGPFPVLFDPESDVVAEKFGTKLFPETWIIDPDGRHPRALRRRARLVAALALDVGRAGRLRRLPHRLRSRACRRVPTRGSVRKSDGAAMSASKPASAERKARALPRADEPPARSTRGPRASRVARRASARRSPRPFPGITRLGGQVVAALYLADSARSMDELAVELGRSKSNIFANLRGLEAAGVVERRREAGARHDSYALRGKYPDVIIGAYIAMLRRVVADKRGLCRRALGLLGDAPGEEAEGLRERLSDLSRKYERLRSS
jgi:DNA-binding transcriptional regulator GbsR (MarR family)/peroxiredoxin